MARKLADRSYAERLRAIAAHGQSLGVLESEGAEEDRVIAVIDPTCQLFQHGFTRRYVAPIHDVRPKRAGIVDIYVDIAVDERAKSNRRTESIPALGRCALRLELLRNEVGQD